MLIQTTRFEFLKICKNFHYKNNLEIKTVTQIIQHLYKRKGKKKNIYIQQLYAKSSHTWIKFLYTHEIYNIIVWANFYTKKKKKKSLLYLRKKVPRSSPLLQSIGQIYKSIISSLQHYQSKLNKPKEKIILIKVKENALPLSWFPNKSVRHINDSSRLNPISRLSTRPSDR